MTKALVYIKPKLHHNYVAFFLTLSCNLRCPYCINLHNGGTRYKQATREYLSADELIMAANRFIFRDDLPLTLQGGEPTLYKGFYRFVNEVKEEVKMDLLTNMMFNVDEFIKNVPVWRFTREAPYAAIRVSYHPGQNDIEDLIRKAFRFQDAGFRIGIYGVEHPSIKEHILETKERCLKLGIDFRTKEFLGEWDGKLYGTFKYEGAVCGNKMKYCECRTTEIIVDPAGYIYKCHSELYNGRNPFANILDEGFNEDAVDEFRSCHFYGDCNPCDVKVKTNRFQIFGHTSVEIRNIGTKNMDQKA
ncbi:MAG: radical SAM protein [Nitrospirae bacterium]|nr:radical SAM protein [Nitrospirota bacterium]